MTLFFLICSVMGGLNDRTPVLERNNKKGKIS